MSKLNDLITIMETAWTAQLQVNKLLSNRIANLEAELEATRSSQGLAN